MRIFVNTRVIHLEELTLLKLYDTKRWLVRDLKEHPDNLEANTYKIELINKEIYKRDGLPMTEYQKAIVSGGRKNG